MHWPRPMSRTNISVRRRRTVLVRYGCVIISSWIAVQTAPTASSVPANAISEVENSLKTALAAERAARSSCPALNYSSTLEQVAHGYNRVTQEYLDHVEKRGLTAKEIPGDPASPEAGMKALGYSGKKGSLLQGAGKDPEVAIRTAVLEGIAYYAINDCGYKDLGVSVVRNANTGYFLTAAVLGGP